MTWWERLIEWAKDFFGFDDGWEEEEYGVDSDG